MQKPRDGGPAFPFKCQGPTTGPEFYYGMTLRDWFAGKALTGILADWGEGKFAPAVFAARAYTIADAMLAEREKESPDARAA